MGNEKNILAILCFLATSPSLVCCSSKSKEVYFNSNQIRKIEWNELLDQEICHYLCLVFSDSCGHCREVLNSEQLPKLVTEQCIFGINQSPSIPTFPHPEFTIGETDINDVWIYAVPTLIEIKDKTVINNVYGSDDVLSLMYSFQI